MRFLVGAVLLVALAFMGRAISAIRGNRLVDRSIGALATLRTPARLEPWDPRSTWIGTTARFSWWMNSFRAMGGSSALHEDLVVTQLDPRQMARLGQQAWREAPNARESLEDVSWEEPLARGSWTMRVGTARYVPNGLDDAAWLVEGLDPGRGLFVSYRGRQAKASRDRAVARVETVMDTYQLTGDLAAHFAAIPRDLGVGISMALPIELVDPFNEEFDPSGVVWVYFRRPAQWADDPALPEQTIAIATFFAAGHAEQESVARGILAREGHQDVVAEVESAAEPGGSEIRLVRHRAGTREESAWLVTAVDPARGVGVAVRTWQQDATRAEAIALVERAIASYRFTGDASYFAPRRAAP